MGAILEVSGLTKTYATGVEALKRIDLSIPRGEIFALLGPNGAGKTTLISIVCGLATPSSGSVLVDGHDIAREYRAARAKIGLVPQELATETFETPLAALRFSRGLFGRPRDDARVERTLRELSLWDKRDAKIQTLSGGMKRRVMIAKAIVHEPVVLFLDEPSAGVDVELRRDMWALVRAMRERGVTIILTTHYIDEAEEIADRIGVIHRGELVVVEDKGKLMRKLGSKELTLELSDPLDELPASLADARLTLSADRTRLVYRFDAAAEESGIPQLLRRIEQHGIAFRDLHTQQTSLEDIFVGLVSERGGDAARKASGLPPLPQGRGDS